MKTYFVTATVDIRFRIEAPDAEAAEALVQSIANGAEVIRAAEAQRAQGKPVDYQVSDFIDYEIEETGGA